MATIKLKDMDQSFKYDIARLPGGENFKSCFTCGTCTASCPVSEVNEDYDPRKIIRMATMGMRKAVLSSDLLWMCQQCYVCYARCPQNVKFADVMGVLREMAVKEGYVEPELVANMEELDRQVHDLRCTLIDNLLKPEDKKVKVITNKLKAIIKTK